MKKELILSYIMITISTGLLSENATPTVQFPIPNSMVYPSSQESDSQNQKEMSFENTFSEIMSVNKDDIDNFDTLKKTATTTFLKKESATDPDSSGTIGYFWDIKNPDDKLQYGGFARADQERFLNVVAVDAQTASSDNQTVPLSSQSIAALAKSQNFDPGFLIYIGTFIGKQDGKTYYLYGRYVNTIIPIDSLDATGHYPVENI